MSPVTLRLQWKNIYKMDCMLFENDIGCWDRFGVYNTKKNEINRSMHVRTKRFVGFESLVHFCHIHDMGKSQCIFEMFQSTIRKFEMSFSCLKAT